MTTISAGMTATAGKTNVRDRRRTPLSPARAWPAALLLGLAGSLWIGASPASAVSREVSLQRCQEKAMKQSQQFEAATTKALDGCLKATLQAILVQHLGGPDAKTAAKCALQMQAVDDVRQRGSSAAEKMQAKIRTACDPSVNPKLKHSLDDVTGKGSPSVANPLNTKKIESFCSQYSFKQTIDSVDDWIRCQRGAAEAAASNKMAAKFPDAPSIIDQMKIAIANLAPDPKNLELRSNASSNIDKLRLLIDRSMDGQADLVCSQPDFT